MAQVANLFGPPKSAKIQPFLISAVYVLTNLQTQSVNSDQLGTAISVSKVLGAISNPLAVA